MAKYDPLYGEYVLAEVRAKYGFDSSEAVIAAVSMCEAVVRCSRCQEVAFIEASQPKESE